MPEINQNSLKILPRLKKRADFVHVQKNGRKWISKSFIVEIVPNDKNHLRLGFTVSKRVSKLAVKRNLLKRRLRNVAADILPAYKDQSFDIVLVGRLSSLERDYQDLQKDLIWCLKKLEITP